MGYIDAQGRPEIVMHPDIVRGRASYRVIDEPRDLDLELPGGAPTDTSSHDPAPAAPLPRPARAARRPG